MKIGVMAADLSSNCCFGLIGPNLVISPQAPKLIHFSKKFCTLQKSIRFHSIQALGFEDRTTG